MIEGAEVVGDDDVNTTDNSDVEDADDCQVRLNLCRTVLSVF